MRTDATISTSELLLGVIAIRLAVLVLVGWSLTLLPRQARESEAVCFPSTATSIDAQPRLQMAGSRSGDPTFDDMLRHD